MHDDDYRAALAREISKRVGMNFLSANFYHDQNNFLIFKGDLPYPFKDEVILSMNNDVFSFEDNVRICSETLKEIFFETKRISSEFRKNNYNIKNDLENNIVLSKIKPLYYKKSPDSEIVSQCNVTYINDMLVRKTIQMLLSGQGSEIRNFSEDKIKLIAESRSLEIDPVLMSLLQTSTIRERRRLYSFLKKYPNKQSENKGMISRAWTREDLFGKEGIHLHKAIKKIDVFHGQIKGVIELASKVIWNAGDIIISRDFPESVKQVLLSEKFKFCKVSEIVDSDYLPDSLKISNIRINNGEKIFIETNMDFIPCPTNFR